MLKLKTNRNSESGNALFLILIAVALFAALSYAVTQSGRGGGSGVDREQALISASQLTQYAAGLRTTVTRMTITGTAVTDVDFGTTEAATDQVFNSLGGGAIAQDPPASSGSTAYSYLDALHATDGWYVFGIGSDAVTSGREILVAASGLSQGVCQEINRGLGLTIVPAVESTAVGLVTPVTGAPDATTHTGTFNAAGVEPFACVQNAAGGPFVYYHAMIEQ